MAEAMKVRPYLESATNAAAIASGAQNSEAIQLKHKGGFPLLIRGFLLTYNGSAQAPSKIAIKDNANDVFIVTEGTCIANVGYDRTAAVPRIFRMVEPQVLVNSGNDWTLFIWAAAAIAIDDLCLTWDGVIRY